jgi:hypothetical protein
MVDKAGGHKWLQQIGKILKKQEGVRLTKEGRQQKKCKHCDMNKYSDTSEKLARRAEKFKLPNANIYLAQ